MTTIPTAFTRVAVRPDLQRIGFARSLPPASSKATLICSSLPEVEATFLEKKALTLRRRDMPRLMRGSISPLIILIIGAMKISKQTVTATDAREVPE